MPTETGPIPLDWRTVVHLGVNLRVEGRYVGFPLDIATTPEGVPTLPVQGSPGETFQMSATGHEGQLADGCTRLTLGARPSVVAGLHLGPRVAYQAHLVPHRLPPHPGGNLRPYGRRCG